MDFAYGATYKVGIEVKRGNVYGAEGDVCSIALSDFPTTTLIASQCGARINYDDRVYPVGIQGSTGYAFDIYGTDGVTLLQTIENPYNFFKFNQINYTLGTKYYVKVRVKRGDQYGAQGAACLVQLNDPNARDLWDKNDDSVSEVVTNVMSAYPNPFTTTFSITPIEGETATLFYQVYDVTGKMIESRSVETNEITNHTIGDEYPTGMYLVIVRQGATTQSFKMIKQ